MSTTKELIEELSKVTPKWAYNCKEFIPGKTPLLYSGPFFDQDEVKMALTAFLEGNWLTTGEYVHRFQNVFAAKFGVKHAHMVNSGSSANLVLITALKKHFGWKDGDEIIVSPVGFPTTVAPICQNGLKPVFADIEMDTLNFDLLKVDEAITRKTVAIFVSPVLGNPPNMDQLKWIINEVKRLRNQDILLIGDNCDSLGSKWDNNLLNSLYFAWTTSFYPAHHISTGEGGMVCSDDEGFIATARSISWWGRDCRCVGKANLSACGTCGNRFSKWLENEGVDVVMDHKYLFVNMGYNLKPLDLQGAIGLAQLRKIDEIEKRRRENFRDIRLIISSSTEYRVADAHPKADPCWFGVPIICPSNEARQKLVDHFEKNKIQTRSYFAGNLLAHPGYKHLGEHTHFPNAEQALAKVFFLGCPPHYREPHIAYIRKVFKEFCNE